MKEKQLREYVQELADDAGSIVALAKRLKISHSYLSTFLRGECPPGEKILKALKMKKAYCFLSKGQTATMKFEDI